MSVQPTQQICPSAPGRLTHHLIPRRAGSSSVLVCVFCKKSEQMLREPKPSADEEEGGDQAGGQASDPEQAHPDHPEQHDEAQDQQLGQTLHPDLLERKSTSPQQKEGAMPTDKIIKPKPGPGPFQPFQLQLQADLTNAILDLRPGLRERFETDGKFTADVLMVGVSIGKVIATWIEETEPFVDPTTKEGSG
jgi:hypothetical protein